MWTKGHIVALATPDGKKFTEAGTLFKARQGKWIGAKVGMFSVTPHGKERGWLDVDWFRVEK